jgi:hypothetical protein
VSDEFGIMIDEVVEQLSEIDCTLDTGNRVLDQNSMILIRELRKIRFVLEDLVREVGRRERVKPPPLRVFHQIWQHD